LLEDVVAAKDELARVVVDVAQRAEPVVVEFEEPLRMVEGLGYAE
jgi:hypothetical protein